MNLYYNLYCAKTRWPLSNANNQKLGYNWCTEALTNVITSGKVLLNLQRRLSNSSAEGDSPTSFKLELLVVNKYNHLGTYYFFLLSILEVLV